MKKNLINPIRPLVLALTRLMVTLGWLLTASASTAAPLQIEQLEFKEARLIDAIRIISELSGDNIVATPDASEAEVTLYLRDVSVRDAIETICRINNLWYRLDPRTATYRIMTSTEYANDLVIHRDDQTRVFTLRNPNVELVADAIANLYGSRVIKSTSGSEVGSGAENNDSNDAINGSNGSNAGNNRSNGSPRVLENELSIDQLASLRIGGDSLNQISATQLQQLSAQQEPIFITRVPEHNLLVVRTGDQQALDSIAGLVKELDRPVPQVLLEMKILDVLVGDDFKSVFNLELTGSRLSGDSAQPIQLGNNPLTGGSLVFEFLNDRLRANIELLQRDNKVRVLSTPMILASNNRPSKLFVGEEQVVVTGYSARTYTWKSASGFESVSTSIVPDTQLREIGNTIEITPFINADGTITLELNQENSSIRKDGGSVQVVPDSSPLPTTLTIDTVNSANLEGTVIARDGFTVAVGGLVRSTRSDEQQKVPFFGDLPGVGKLFTSTIETEEQGELVLLITPHVIDNAAEGEAISRERLAAAGSTEGSELVGPETDAQAPSPTKLTDVDPSLVRQALALSRQGIQRLLESPNRAGTGRLPPHFKQWQAQPGLSVDALGSLQQQGWHTTLLRLDNQGRTALDLEPGLFNQRWLGQSFDRPQLESGQQGHALIVSREPLLNSVQRSSKPYLLTEHALEGDPQ